MHSRFLDVHICCRALDTEDVVVIGLILCRRHDRFCVYSKVRERSIYVAYCSKSFMESRSINMTIACKLTVSSKPTWN